MLNTGHYIFMGLGGGLGAVTRAGLGRLLDDRFPWSTLLVNVAGSFMVGVLTTLFISVPALAPGYEEQVALGFCGGFTTFSSFSYHTFNYFREDRIGTGILNLALNLVLSLGSAWLGIILSGKFIG